MIKIKVLVIVIALLTMVTGCGSIDITYFGKTLKPTEEAQLFFERENIPYSYYVMGKVFARAPNTFSGKRIKKKIIKTAEEKGADAVLITLYTQIPGGSSCFNNDSYGYGDGFARGCGGYGDGFGGGYGGWNGGESVEFYYQVLIKAEFLKYKMQNQM